MPTPDSRALTVRYLTGTLIVPIIMIPPLGRKPMRDNLQAAPPIGAILD